MRPESLARPGSSPASVRDVMNLRDYLPRPSKLDRRKTSDLYGVAVILTKLPGVLERAGGFQQPSRSEPWMTARTDF